MNPQSHDIVQPSLSTDPTQVQNQHLLTAPPAPPLTQAPVGRPSSSQPPGQSVFPPQLTAPTAPPPPQAPGGRSSSSQTPAQTAFPQRSGRQRASNINVENPEAEFRKTAINACRSTIAQQEAELKRQKEANDIRNKRILQLESVVDHATEFIAAREIPSDISESPLHTILARIEKIECRLSNLQTSNPSTSIVINSCKSDHSSLVQKTSSSTQTDHPSPVHDSEAAPTSDVEEQVETQQGASPETL